MKTYNLTDKDLIHIQNLIENVGANAILHNDNESVFIEAESIIQFIKSKEVNSINKKTKSMIKKKNKRKSKKES